MSAVFEGLPVKSVSVENMLRQRDAVLEKFRAAVDLLREAREIAAAANVGFPRLKFDEHRYAVYNMLDDSSRGDVEKNLQRAVDSGAWAYLLSESGLRTFMDQKARQEWDESIEKGNFPEFNDANLRATFTLLYDSRADMFERGVIAVFKSLSWDYKTNKPFRFGKRIVLRFIRGSITAARGGGTSLAYVNQRKTDELDDLTRVLSVLDGKPEPDHRQGWFHLLNRVNHTTDPDAENDYMSVRSFRNGNGHVTFKRLDLVEKMNRIIAKHYPGALPHDHHEKETA
jgi:hypothetical protein